MISVDGQPVETVTVPVQISAVNRQGGATQRTVEEARVFLAVERARLPRRVRERRGSEEDPGSGSAHASPRTSSPSSSTSPGRIAPAEPRRCPQTGADVRSGHGTRVRGSHSDDARAARVSAAGPARRGRRRSLSVYDKARGRGYAPAREPAVRASPPCSSRRSSSFASSAIPGAASSRRSATSSWRRASATSCGARCRTSELLAAGRDRTSCTCRACSSAQVKRMLADPKAAALADNFAGQWLETRSLDAVTPRSRRSSRRGAPSCATRCATETRLFFDAVLRENRPISDFIDGKYTFLNERLAQALRHPGRRGLRLPPRRAHDRSAQRRVHPGQRADRVELSDAHVGRAARQVPARERPQRAAASAARRRAGARRGAGRRREVASRADRAASRRCRSARAATSRWIRSGFALENYDAIGRWRTEDGKFPLDVSGDPAQRQDVFRPDRAEGAPQRTACRPSRGAWPRRC